MVIFMINRINNNVRNSILNDLFFNHSFNNIKHINKIKSVINRFVNFIAANDFFNPIKTKPFKHNPGVSTTSPNYLETEERIAKAIRHKKEIQDFQQLLRDPQLETPELVSAFK